MAEKAIETGSADELLAVLSELLADEVKHRFDQITALQQHAEGPVRQAREHVEATLGLQVWSHKLYLAIKVGAHAGPGVEHHKGQDLPIIAGTGCRPSWEGGALPARSR